MIDVGGGYSHTFTQRASSNIDLHPDHWDWEVTGTGKIIARHGNSWQALDFKVFEKSSGGTASVTYSKIYWPEAAYNKLPEAFEAAGLQQVEIKTYSPDAIRLEGFLAGTYYYYSDAYVEIPREDE